MKKKWYKLYLANNDIILVYRTWWERWWLSSDKYPKFRRDDNNRLLTFPSEAHWVLFWELIPKEDVDIAKEEIIRMKEEASKRVEE